MTNNSESFLGLGVAHQFRFSLRRCVRLAVGCPILRTMAPWEPLTTDGSTSYRRHLWLADPMVRYLLWHHGIIALGNDVNTWAGTHGNVQLKVKLSLPAGYH